MKIEIEPKIRIYLSKTDIMRLIRSKSVFKKSLITLDPKIKWSVWKYPKFVVTGVSSILNSATGTPLLATDGANMAAGYTTDDVPTW